MGHFWSALRYKFGQEGWLTGPHNQAMTVEGSGHKSVIENLPSLECISAQWMDLSKYELK
jgi:hypothetical protein